MNRDDEDIVEVELTEEERKRLNRRILRMLSITGATLVVLIVATYAWFIGISTVNISDFNVQVETLEGLTISADGVNFSDSVTINGDNINNEGMMSINHWAGSEGLMPVSSSGILSSAGHLALYSTTSINSIDGGYRVRTQQVDNSSTEQNGYIVFDLFLKNTTNTQGTLPNSSAYDRTEAEDVYLLQNSSATLSEVQDGTGEGIQNSTRVGFFQIAYAPLAATSPTLIGMGCTSNSETSVVGLCSTTGNIASQGYNWNIWEPNDNVHVTKALDNYHRLCKIRTGVSTYTDTCATVAADQPIYTYTINKDIENNNVNQYDGLNTYMATVSDPGDVYSSTPRTLDSTKELAKTYSFKGSENVITSTYESNRKPIFYLPPNSITKLRVYVWIEGQDIDNLDYLEGINRQLVVSFGFTKDKYELTLENSTNIASPSASESPETGGE